MRPEELIQFLLLVLAILVGVGSPPADGAVYGEDHRQTEEEYADSHLSSLQDLKDSVAATGVLSCGFSRGTAQITLRSDVLTTAAHVLLDPKTCKPRVKVSNCSFSFVWRGATHSIPVAANSLRTGLTCPKDSNKADDWAVIRLIQPAVGPTPYQIDDAKTIAAQAGDRLFSVEALSADFCTRSKSKNDCLIDRKRGWGFQYPKTLQDCSLRSVEHPDGKLFLTDCAEGSGASGSGIFTQDDRLLIGILYSDSMTQKEDRQEVATGKPIVKPYDRQDWSAAEIPVQGAFADAIYQAAGRTRTSGSGDRKAKPLR